MKRFGLIVCFAAFVVSLAITGCSGSNAGSEETKEKPTIDGAPGGTTADMILCEGCKMEHKKELMKDVGNGRMLCTDCGCADMTKCANCGMEHLGADMKEVDGKTLCADCAAKAGGKSDATKKGG